MTSERARRVGAWAGTIERSARQMGLACLAVGLVLGILVTPASGQLTAEDIAALRKQGEAEGWTFTISENPATKYPLEQLCGYIEADDLPEVGSLVPLTLARDLPASFDWRTLGGCTLVKNQGGCGSCWAFAAIGAMECNILIGTDETTNLSEQWLVSCTAAGSCSGGSHWTASQYLRCPPAGLTDPCGHSGAVREADFPYVASDAPCGCPYPHPYCLISSTFMGSYPTVTQIKQAIYDYGPVACTMHANAALQGYGGGVFNACEDLPTNHAIVLVGWDDNQGTEGVWFMRNSWGSWWGENGGYARIPYGCSRIGHNPVYVEYPQMQDCNSNEIDDELDISSGTSLDENGDEYPDECQRLHVDPDATGANNGKSWTDAYTDPHEAFTKAEDPPGVVLEIWMVAGTYCPAPAAGDRTTSFCPPFNVVVYGGFAGVETSLSERDPVNNRVILSGDLNGNDAPGFVNNGENSYHVVAPAASGFGDLPTIDGCTITAGNANGSWPNSAGAGAFVEDGGLVLRNCVIRSNSSTGYGGGIFLWNAGDVTLINCALTGNTSDKGGALSSDVNSVTIINSSFSGNTATDRGGGIYRFGGTYTITGSVFWDNTDSSGNTEQAQIDAAVAFVDLNYSCVQGLTGGFGGTGNIDTNPSFADADGADDQFGTADDDLHIQTGSPCIDAGDTTALTTLPFEITTDLDMNPRFVDDPDTDDTGVGDPPEHPEVVDMGAYEYQSSVCGAIAARSLKDHGTAGELSLDMGVSGGIEPRTGQVAKLEIDLDSSASVSVTDTATVNCSAAWTGTATVTDVSTNGVTVTVEFSPALPDQAYCTIALDCMTNDVCVRMCEGDMNRDGATNTTDASNVKPRFGATLVDGNCEWDFNCTGAINTTDYSNVKARFGKAAPECP